MTERCLDWITPLNIDVLQLNSSSGIHRWSSPGCINGHFGHLVTMEKDVNPTLTDYLLLTKFILQQSHGWLKQANMGSAVIFSRSLSFCQSRLKCNHKSTFRGLPIHLAHVFPTGVNVDKWNSLGRRAENRFLKLKPISVDVALMSGGLPDIQVKLTVVRKASWSTDSPCRNHKHIVLNGSHNFSETDWCRR